MKHFVLIPNLSKDPDYRVTQAAAAVLQKAGGVTYAEERHAASLHGVISFASEAFPKEAEAIVVLGGDGSMIDAATTALRYDLPMIGINLGKLGYLTGIEPDDLSPLEGLLSEHPETKSHIVLCVTVHHRDGSKTVRHAVNDAVVSRRGDVGMARFSLTDGTPNGTALDYYGDGLIVCTPLGSTAYSLSAGGPIVDSALEAVCVTPICAHSFFSRSILFAKERELKIVNASDKDLDTAVHIDGHESIPLLAGEVLTVTVPKERLTILTGGNRGVLDALRKKMMLSDAKG